MVGLNRCMRNCKVGRFLAWGRNRNFRACILIRIEMLEEVFCE